MIYYVFATTGDERRSIAFGADISGLGFATITWRRLKNQVDQCCLLRQNTLTNRNCGGLR